MLEHEKDIVKNPQQHEKISPILFENFNGSIAWTSIIHNDQGIGSNGKMPLTFFPIDNKKRPRDPSLTHLLSLVEHEIDKSDYVHKLVPLSWLRILDEIKATRRNCLTIVEVQTICQKFNLTTADTIQLTLLLFLHEMGIVMWHNETNLRSLIILDPIEYFVVPATTVICKHKPDMKDSISISHKRKIHQSFDTKSFS